MLTFKQKLHGMLTIDELYDIDERIHKGTTFEELCKLFAGRCIYFTEGTYGEQDTYELDTIRKGIVDNVLKLKNKDNILYGGKVSLFTLNTYKLYDGLYPQVWELVPTRYLA